MTTITTPRAIREIAADIYDNWPKPYFGAVPYLRAMRSLTTMNNNYHQDGAEGIVRYFLVNAQTWRGEDARRIKAELNGMLKA